MWIPVHICWFMWKAILNIFAEWKQLLLKFFPLGAWVVTSSAPKIPQHGHPRSRFSTTITLLATTNEKMFYSLSYIFWGIQTICTADTLYIQAVLADRHTVSPVAWFCHLVSTADFFLSAPAIASLCHCMKWHYHSTKLKEEEFLRSGIIFFFLYKINYYVW